MRFKYKAIKDKDGISEINLSDLFNNTYDDQPWLVESYNCIYLITNLINNKVYVGQATYFYSRFCVGEFSHLYESENSNRIIDLAIRKYGSENFKVEILESGLPSKESMNEREIYYILKFKSNVNEYKNFGYNMTKGGDKADQLHTEESFRKSHRSNLLNHKGRYSFNTPEFYESQREKFGGVLAFNTPEANAKRRRTLIELYGDPAGQLHTKESIEKARIPRILTQYFNNIYNRVEYVTSRRWEERVVQYLDYNRNSVHEHIVRVFSNIELLRSDYRWTKKIEKLFKDIYKYYFKYWPDWSSNNLPMNLYEDINSK